MAGNHRPVVELLLEHGADPSKKDTHGHSALDTATDEEMRALLRQWL